MQIERGLAFAACLGIVNIVLNTAAHRASRDAGSFHQLWTTPMFYVAFLIGTLALLCMLGLYFSGYPLARGILIAGATSILLGTVWGVLLGRTQLSGVEWALWSAIALFYIYRFVSR